MLAILPAFLLACLILAELPGPATALFIHRTVRDGRGAGLAAVAGNEIGLFLWLLAGGAGLSALLTANRVLFDAMHIVGAAVLRTIRRRIERALGLVLAGLGCEFAIGTATR